MAWIRGRSSQGIVWPVGAERIALVDATVLDGGGGPAVAGCTVVVEAGRIAAVAPDAVVPRGAAVVDAAGAHVVPGLVDAHVHLAFADDPRRVLRGGVTAVRDLGWPPAAFGAVRSAAEDAGLLVRHVGPILTPPGGYPTRAAWAPPGTGREVGSPTEVRASVADVVALGGSAVKIAMEPRVGPVFDQELLGLLVEVAHAADLPVTVHAGTPDAVEACVAAGVDELAHVPFDLRGAEGDLATRCVAAGMRLVPTLHCRHGEDRAQRTAALAFVRSWIVAGGAVAYGTDLGNAHTSAGADAEELRLLHEAGLPPAQVLVAATSAAADAIGSGGEVGRIAPGRRADLLVLADDPLHDVTALARPRLVVAGGRQVG